jgi:phospholipid/cholesterol/gamma-HCH transport system substrate-binding protein
MPRTRSLALSELRIGALTVTALVIGATVIFMLGSRSGFFWQYYHLKTRFAEVPGLKVGAPVRVAGIEAGSVSAITLAATGVDVEFVVSRALRSRITAASAASLGSLGLLGQTTLDVRPSATGEPIPEWGYVASGRSVGQLSSAADSATASLDELTRLLQGLRRGEGTIGRLLRDEQLYKEVQAMVSASEAVVARIRDGQGTLGKLVSDPSVYAELDGSLTRLNALLGRVEAGEGSLGRLVKDDRLVKSLTSASDKLDGVATRLSEGEGTAGKLLTDGAMYDRLNAVAERLDRLLARLEQGEGTFGQLLQDRQLYENMNEATIELRALVADVRKNPKKYLKFSFF